MRYFVVWPDGQRFGPAEVDRLNQWVAEGRVGPATTFEEESTGRVLHAAQVPGLSLHPQAPVQTPMHSGYPQQPMQQSYLQPGQQQMYMPGMDYGARDIRTAHVLLILTPILGFCMLSCFPLTFGLILLPVIAMVYAARAGEKGHPQAAGVRSMAVFMIGAIVVLGFLVMGFLSRLMSG